MPVFNVVARGTEAIVEASQGNAHAIDATKDAYVNLAFEAVGVAGGAVIDDIAVDNYRQRYGSDANLYLNNEVTPAQIDDIIPQWGEMRPAMNMRLDHADPMFRLNLAKIIALFYDASDFGSYTSKQKRDGMLNGIIRPQSRGTQAAKQNPIPAKSGRQFLEPTAAEHGGSDVIFNYVFPRKSVFGGNDKQLSAKFNDCINDYLCKRDTSNHDLLEKCLKKLLGGENWRQHPGWNSISSRMLVREWVTTPWHYETLPYQRQYAIFKDGECYSEGCKRCLRPFYEYAYHMYADAVSSPWSSRKGTYGYPQDLWYQPNINDTPLPFHDPYFWSPTADWDDAQPSPPDPTIREGGTEPARNAPRNVKRARKLPQATQKELDNAAIADRNDATREFDDYVGGTMAWPAFQLLKDKISHGDRERKAFMNYATMHFRRYFNAAYSDAVAGADLKNEKGYYKPINQGVMNTRQKARFGVTGYRLQRSHKYGNVCRDCASVLDRAPGLFVRNNRWSFDGGLIPGNINRVTDNSYCYWTDAIGDSVEIDDGRGGTRKVPIDLDDLLAIYC